MQTVIEVKDFSAQQALAQHRLLQVATHDNLNPSDCSCRWAVEPALDPPRPMGGNEGRVCAACGGSNMVRTGTCHSCTDCGASDGCG